MSQNLELLFENSSKWSHITIATSDVQKKEIKPFTALALKELEGEPDSRTSSLMSVDKFGAVREVVRHVARLRSATRVPWNEEDIKHFLESLRFSPECITEFTTILCTDSIYQKIPKHLRVKPGIVSLQWKIDLSLSQAIIDAESPDQDEIKDVVRRNTYVILIITLTNNQIRSYRISVSKFHELRYVIASALKSMIVLERRKCMKKD